jgi:hypothetical protein
MNGGVHKLVESLHPLSLETTWLDFGAGLGRERRDVRMFAYEPGAAVRPSSGTVPYFSSSELDSGAHPFDIVTAIDVLEHTAEPLRELRRILICSKARRLFFYATGNS